MTTKTGITVGHILTEDINFMARLCNTKDYVFNKMVIACCDNVPRNHYCILIELSTEY